MKYIIRFLRIAASIVSLENEYTHDKVSAAADQIAQKVPFKPKIGIICGTGLDSIVECLEDPTVSICYGDIANFPVTTVEGHPGKLVFGNLAGMPVVCMQGRFHYYEGHPLWKCTMPVRVMKLLGVTHIIISNAAGAVNSKFQVGDIMIITDHINLMGLSGNNPLLGPNDDSFGPRFPPMTMAYDKDLQQKARNAAKKLKMAKCVKEGVYACLGGPNFETVAEVKMLGLLGADAVGMSTVPEVIVARHCNLKVLAFSLISNICVKDYNTKLEAKHTQAMDIGKRREDDVNDFVHEIIEQIAEEEAKAKKEPERERCPLPPPPSPPKK